MSSEIEFVGPKIPCSISVLESLKADFYSAFKSNSETYNINDEVFVKSLTNPTPEVCQLLGIYKRTDVHENNHKAFVRRFTWAYQLKHHFERKSIEYSHKSEVVKDLSRVDYIINLSDITGKCKLYYCDVNEPYYILLNKLDKRYSFSCRFMLKYKGELSPVEIKTINNTNVQQPEKAQTANNTNAQQPEEANEIVNSIEIVNSESDEELDYDRLLELNKSEQSNQSLHNYSIIDSPAPVLRLRRSKQETQVRRSHRPIKRVSYADYISPVKTTSKTNGLLPKVFLRNLNRNVCDTDSSSSSDEEEIETPVIKSTDNTISVNDLEEDITDSDSSTIQKQAEAQRNRRSLRTPKMRFIIDSDYSLSSSNSETNLNTKRPRKSTNNIPLVTLRGTSKNNSDSVANKNKQTTGRQSTISVSSESSETSSNTSSAVSNSNKCTPRRTRNKLASEGSLGTTLRNDDSTDGKNNRTPGTINRDSVSSESTSSMDVLESNEVTTPGRTKNKLESESTPTNKRTLRIKTNSQHDNKENSFIQLVNDAFNKPKNQQNGEMTTDSTNENRKPRLHLRKSSIATENAQLNHEVVTDSTNGNRKPRLHLRKSAIPIKNAQQHDEVVTDSTNENRKPRLHLRKSAIATENKQQQGEVITDSTNEIHKPRLHLRISANPTKNDTPKRITRRTSVFNANVANETTDTPSRRTRSKTIDSETDVPVSTPKSRKNPREENELKSVQKTLRKTPRTTKRKHSYNYELHSSSESSDCETPTKNSKEVKNAKTPKSSKKNLDECSTPNKSGVKNRAKMLRDGVITPSLQNRDNLVKGNNTPLMIARSNLHVSYVPNALPCREKEYSDISNFIEGKLSDKCGGCMYISGVPGTGKTATVTSVIDSLLKDVSSGKVEKFDYVNINGMRLTEPRQAYVEIIKQLGYKTVPWIQAQTLLEERFTKVKGKKIPTIMVIDELDILCTKRQDVVYNLLDWPNKAKTQLIVITIANTMDLPERLLMNRVASRLGLTRLAFQAYTHKQLQDIVMKRLAGTNCFNPDAIQLVARKVASVSGDARRALDICRRAAEIAESEGPDTYVSMKHVNEALNAMITQPKLLAIKQCSKLEKLILQAIVAEMERTGLEETAFGDVYRMLTSVCAIEGFQSISTKLCLAAISRLNASRLILADEKCTNLTSKIILNVSTDDIFYALRNE